MGTLRKRAYQYLVSADEDDLWANRFQAGIMLLIALNVLVSILETEATIRTLNPDFFFYFEGFSVAIFTVEYLGRLWCIVEDPSFRHPVKGRLRQGLTVMALIDFLAIAPFYLQVVLPNLDLRFVRALRLFRLFRIFKLGRWSESFQTIVHVIQSRYEELTISMIIVAIATVVCGSVMYVIEADAQPEAFRSIPAGIWWAIISITTIGYGDVSPVTPLGKTVGGFIAVMGICIFALPVGVLGAGFVEEMAKKKGRTNARISPFMLPKNDEEAHGQHVDCPHCGEAIQIDFDD